MKKKLLFLKPLVLVCFILANFSVDAQTTVQIGTGTDIPANTLYSPVYRFSATSTTTGGRSNILFTQSEMAAAGIPNGATILSVEFHKTNVAEFVTPANFTMYMANTSNTDLATTLTWASIQSTHSQVYANSAFNVPNPAGWVQWLITPFVYTGGALEIAQEHTMAGNGGATDAFKWEYTTGNADKIVGVSSPTGATLNGTVAGYKHRPNIKITYTTSPCSSTPYGGTSASSASSVCANENFLLSVSGYTLNLGIGFQWQSSPTPSGPWTNIAGATLPSLTTSQTSDTYYRCEVICNPTSSSDYSTTTYVAIQPPLAGTYTIGTGGDFATFNTAIAAMNCGVAGPVTFNVLAGTYTEQVEIPNVPGTSATNTITINGQGNTLSFAPITSERYVLLLNGAKHVTIENLNITSTSTSYGFGIQLMNGADFCTVRNCTINSSAVTSTTAAASGGIVGSGSLTSNTTAGTFGNNILLENNVLLGGTTGAYYGIVLYGTTATPQQNIIIRNNVVQDNYGGGIRVSNCDFVTIEGNDVSRPNRTNSTTFEGIYVLGTKSEGTIVRNNKVHSTQNNMPSNSSTVYPLYNAAAGSASNPMLIYNNLVYNIGGSGTQYGYYNNANFVKFYNNTIVLDNQTATAGATRCVYHTGTANLNVDYVNNIFFNTRSGTTDKFGIYLNSGAINGTINHNSFHIVPATATGAIGYLGSNQTTLADWQIASGHDLNSIVANPQFTSASNFLPLNLALKAGIPVPTVNKDFTGILRSIAAPTMGAYEIAHAIDLGTDGVMGLASAICPSANEPIFVRVSNFANQAIDFTSSPASITVNIAGTTIQTLNAVVNNNSLAGNAPLAIGNFIEVPVGTLNMSAPGNYEFTVSVAVTGDGDSSNDNSIMQTIVVNPLTEISTQPVSESACEGSNASFSVVASGSALNYKWMLGTNIINGATSPTLSLSNLTSGDAGTYTVEVSGDCGTESSTAVTLTVYALPTVVANATATIVCEGDTLILTGSGADTYVWDNNVFEGVAFPVMADETYTVTGTDANGCENTDQISITVNQLPVVVGNASASVVCEGDTVTLTGSGADFYSWNNGVVDNVPFASTLVDTYIVTGVDANNCANSATVTFTVNPLPNVVANTSATAVCDGDQFTLFGSGASVYTWTNNIQDNVPMTVIMTGTVSDTATYTVTGTDLNGCTASDDIEIILNPLPVVTLGGFNTICKNHEPLELSGGSPVNGTYSISTGVITHFDPANATVGTHTITYGFTNANGCTNSAESTIDVDECASVGKYAVSGNLQVKLYPNPAFNHFSLEIVSPEREEAEIMLFNSNGKLISVEKMPLDAGSNKVEINTSQYARGMYFLKVVTKANISNDRLVLN